MHYKTKDLDLISEEVKHHSSCHKAFTRGYSAKCRKDISANSAKLTYEETKPSKEHLISKLSKSLLKFMLFETRKLFQ